MKAIILEIQIAEDLDIFGRSRGRWGWVVRTAKQRGALDYDLFASKEPTLLTAQAAIEDLAKFVKGLEACTDAIRTN